MEPLYILAETEDLSAITLPLKTTSRIKYTCFTVSPNLIIFGATSGGLYVFNREPCTFLNLIPTKEGALTHVTVSPDEKLCGFSTVKGTSCIVELHCGSATRRILSNEHTGAKVTAVQWNSYSSQLYVGDNVGKISVISITSFMTPAVTLMQLDSQIVQMDCCSPLLLVSTLTRCYLCDTMHEQYRQIGTRLRDGQFGSCFYNSDVRALCAEENFGEEKLKSGRFSSLSEGEHLLADERYHSVKLFCARPGSRLWEVRIDGTVLNTHQFKELLASPPTGVIRPPPTDIPPLPCSGALASLLWPEQSFNFSKLYRVAGKFLFTYHADGIYVLNPTNGQVVLWSDTFSGVVDAQTIDDTIYLWMGDSDVRAVLLTALDKFLIQLYLQREYLLCCNVCAAYSSSIKPYIPFSSKLHLLLDLVEKVRAEGTAVENGTYDIVSELLEEISKFSKKRENSQLLQCGIFIVNNTHSLSKTPGGIGGDVGTKETRRSLLSAGAKLRSQSSSPNATSRNQLNTASSSNSLPELGKVKIEDCIDPPDVDESYDPYPDLPLSALTSAETVAALKELGNSVSETFTNGTRSLKEKWQAIEGKLRGQETYISTPLDIGQVDYQNNSVKDAEVHSEAENEEQHPHESSQTKLDVSLVVQLCTQITSHQIDNGKSLQELQFELLNSVASLYTIYKKSLDEIVCNDKSERCSSEAVVQWLTAPTIIPFPFAAYFTSNIIIELQRHFHFCLKSGILTQWLRNILPDYNLDHDAFPSHIRNLYSKEVLRLDVAMSRMLQLYAHLLDPTMILQCLDTSEASCSFLSWNAIMDHFEKAPISIASVGDTNSWPLPRLLSTIMVLLRLGQMESSRSMGEHIGLKQILNLVLRLKNVWLENSRLFLAYIDKLSDERLKEELKDKEVHLFTLQAFEAHNPNTNAVPKCTCSFPVGAKTLSVSFHRVGRALLSHFWSLNNKVASFELCHKVVGMWPEIIAFRRTEPVEAVLPLLLHLGDENELQRRIQEVSLSTWESILSQRADLQSGVCLNCQARIAVHHIPPSLSWSSLSLFLLRSTRPLIALQMLSKYTHLMKPGELDKRFYQNCLLSALVEERGKGLGVRLLDHLNPNTLPVRRQVAEELEQRAFNTDIRQHWGLRLELSRSNCRCCMLPLNSSLLLEGSGISAFQCGHAFHAVCMKQRVKNNLNRLGRIVWNEGSSYYFYILERNCDLGSTPNINRSNQTFNIHNK